MQNINPQISAPEGYKFVLVKIKHGRSEALKAAQKRYFEKNKAKIQENTKNANKIKYQLDEEYRKSKQQLSRDYHQRKLKLKNIDTEFDNENV